jgi:uncharacterized protein (TIGR02757 family)
MNESKLKNLSENELKDFLDQKVLQYNKPAFITDDPISIPHQFTVKEDIEISAFLTALIAWGQRPVILKNAKRLLEQMDDSPFEFISAAKKADFERFNSFVHRTFNGTDCIYFLKGLQKLYKKHEGLEAVFSKSLKTSNGNMAEAISLVRKTIFKSAEPGRTAKHFADPLKNSSAKRINMFLRWMVRKDANGVDFGIWKSIQPSALYCPLDLHSGRVARSLGILTRKQDDWKAVEELTASLRSFDKKDPVKYDFALFGIGVNRDF